MTHMTSAIATLGLGLLGGCGGTGATAPTPPAVEQFTFQPGPHQGKDIWVTSVFSYGDDFGVNDTSLQVGGWADYYATLIAIDALSLLGMPRSAITAKLALVSYARGDQSAVVGMDLRRILGPWDQNTGWYTPKPQAQSIGNLPAPAAGSVLTIDVTALYNSWQATPSSNYGIELFPLGNNNQFTVFRSSGYLAAPTHRPRWELTYTPSVQPLRLKLPLPGGKSWQVSTEIGSRDCLTNDLQLPSHLGLNHFSLDFVPVSSPGVPATDVPIFAAADGYAFQSIPNDPNNGNYVVIDHDSDQNPSTGYTTRYLHLKQFDPQLRVGPIKQGDPIGTMGNTGTANVHLHFGVRYNNDGSPNQEALTFVTMEGLHLVEYMTECQGGMRTRYYPSTNRVP